MTEDYEANEIARQMVRVSQSGTGLSICGEPVLAARDKKEIETASEAICEAVAEYMSAYMSKKRDSWREHYTPEVVIALEGTVETLRKELSDCYCRIYEAQSSARRFELDLVKARKETAEADEKRISAENILAEATKPKCDGPEEDTK